jgi:hypothetical protein
MTVEGTVGAPTCSVSNVDQMLGSAVVVVVVKPLSFSQIAHISFEQS